MANKKISAATAISTIAMADMLPVAKSADTTAYYITLGQMMGMGGVMSLSAAVTAGATSITLRSVPSWMAAYGGYIAIDPYTTEFEFRQVETVTGNVVTFTTALTYNHAINDNVIWTEYGAISAKWALAKGDDSTDNSTPLARALTQANTIGSGLVFLPRGTYRHSTGLILGDGVSLVGEGQYTSILKATAAITMLTVDTGDSAGGGFRYQHVENLTLEGNSLATIGLYTGKSVHSRFSNLLIEYCTGGTGYGVVLDRSQNQTWDNVLSAFNDTNLYICNGSANNNFLMFHSNSANTAGIHIKEDATMPGYILGGTNTGNQNCFVRCISERGTPIDAIEHIENGHYNKFYGCSFHRDATSTTPLLVIAATANYNHFRDCRINANDSTAAMVTNAGDDTLFDNCSFTDLAGATDIIQVSNGYIRFRGVMPTNGTINVTAGTTYGRVFEYFERQAGTTALRPAPGDVLGCMYFDTTLGIPIWYDGNVLTGWCDSSGASV